MTKNDAAQQAATGAPHRDEAGRDKPWIMRTYSGHSSATASNALYRSNLAKGQTGLSVAFDLPTQTGYDSDHPLAKGEVGKVGVPIGHLGDMEALFEGIPLGQMNTSMTINATAPWLLALYVAAAERQGATRAELTGTTQNDIIKEYLSRGTYIFPPEPSMRLTTDVIAFTYRELPKWNPVNVCSYHLQEAGATPVQELAFALATAIAILDRVRAAVPAEDLPTAVGRISFFVNAGLRFVTEICKMRAFARLWDEICRDRYGVEDPKLRRFRYGVQVNSLGLTEQQPENNVYRILLEALAVTLSKDARARAVQLPAWNEALGLPRPWDQQWSLRLQQILAYETDLLEYGDIFEGSTVIEAEVETLIAQARAELDKIEAMGGAVAAVEFELHEAGAGRSQRAPGRRDRIGRAGRGRRQQVDRDRALAADRQRRRRRLPRRRPGHRGDPDREPERLARRARPGQGRPGAGRAGRGRPLGRQHHGAVDRLRPRRASPPANGARPCATCSAPGARPPASRAPGSAAPGRRRQRAPARPSARRRWTPCATRSRRSPAGSAAGSRCWSASPASTATPTAPSRSRSRPATPAWRWSTRASA